LARRGEIWWVRLDSTLGSEIAKTSPCLILSSDVLNQRRRTVVVVPLSSSPQFSPPLLVPVRCGGRDVVAVTDQIRAVSKERLDRCIETLSIETLESVEPRNSENSGARLKTLIFLSLPFAPYCDLLLAGHYFSRLRFRTALFRHIQTEDAGQIFAPQHLRGSRAALRQR